MGRPDHRTDQELLRASGSEPEAFGSFYRRHVAALLGYLLRRTDRPDLAADVCAETFACVLERLDAFDPARGSARGWLFTIAGNQLVDAVRRGQVDDRARRRLGMERRELTDRDLARIDELLDRESEDAVRGLVADLPEEQRDALHARIVEERDYAEIAASLAVSEAVVRKRVSRGLALLRGQLGEARR
ncbi:putative RNA polymerase ECF-subfamily sigma factor [Patulibacter medicamentivorans]|uniref:Putative RNA polymerase ECF-subfamily sigma factor n=1 Tax=Patulibacter medicamentivorans TaxID=1097667 RepID=H0E2N3_9ACTN|nr:sigma-70 family RNA polymerase sigma factor [Patulibacter medicamentivorans]EHN12047.1 putative RNA polymerase ECF-subfamily sigma factor [Patulibacter medicamentivorans]